MNLKLAEMLLKTRETFPDGFEWYKYECLPHAGPTLCVEFTGAVAPLLLSGKRKGRRNWKKMDRSTKRRRVVSIQDYEAFAKTWATETGKCPHCLGEAKELESISVDKGTTWRPCSKCKGTGAWKE